MLLKRGAEINLGHRVFTAAAVGGSWCASESVGLYGKDFARLIQALSKRRSAEA
jgi:hypothetical protein